MVEREPAVVTARLRKLLARMIDIYSPSGKEKQLLDFLHDYLKRRGLPVTRQRVDERRYNLIVAPTTDDLELGFIGHVDTVPAYDLDDYSCREEGDRIIGLGAADMKGGCAAMVEAFVALVESGARLPPVALCLVVGEEEYGDGIARLVEELRFPWALDGEPTDLVPCFSHDGYLELELSARGRRKHAAVADGSHTAITVVLRVVEALIGHLEQHRQSAIYNIRDLYSAAAGFAVPERCDASLDLHLPPGAPMGEIVAELEEVADRIGGDAGEVELDLEVVTMEAGFSLPTRGPLAEALQRGFAKLNLAWQPAGFRSHSDANHLWAEGIRTVMLGPGSLDVAHSPDEAVDFAQVERAATIYLELLRGWSSE